MRAALLTEIGRPLTISEVDVPTPKERELLIRVSACGVCRTDLHIVDGDLPATQSPLIPGHQIVGQVVESTVPQFHQGQRVGVPWLGWTCGHCGFCLASQENLCDTARFTGYHINGGFAEYCVADARYCFPLNPNLSDLQVAPLLCAGLIGYRALRMAGDAGKLGFYGFGSAAHILLQVARHERREVYAVTRPHDDETQMFATNLGAIWGGGSDTEVPTELDAAIIFAPAGNLVPKALQAVRKGGVVVCAGIHMSDIPSFPYELLWGERSVKSVANLTRNDGEQFLKLASEIQIETQVAIYPLDEVNDALNDLRSGRVYGSAVIEI